MLQNIEFIGVFCERAAFGTAPLTSKKDKLQNKEKKATLALANKKNRLMLRLEFSHAVVQHH